jgi:hypothetical protein
MKAKRIALLALIVFSTAGIAGCNWSVTGKKTMGKPAEIDVTISGQFPALKAMGMQTAAVTVNDLYIETAGTDFGLDTSGNVALTLLDSNRAAIAASTFPWAKSGTRLVFVDPTSVQNWLNQYPSAANVSSKLVVGSTPVDGQDHQLTTAVVYQGATQASQTQTFSAECYSRIHTVMLCPQ